MHVYHICVTVEVHIPDLFGDQSPREHFARASREQRQEQEFFWRQVQMRTTTNRFMMEQIKFQVCDAELFRLSRWAAAENRPHARQEFRKGEWLDQVIVSPKLQALNAILNSITSGEEEDRCLLPRAAKLGDDGPTIAYRDVRARCSPSSPCSDTSTTKPFSISPLRR